MALPRVETGVVPLHLDDQILEFARFETRQEQALIENIRCLIATAGSVALDGQIDAAAPLDEIPVRRLWLTVAVQVKKDLFQDAILVLHFGELAGADIAQTTQRCHDQLRIIAVENGRRLRRWRRQPA